MEMSETNPANNTPNNTNWFPQEGQKQALPNFVVTELFDVSFFLHILTGSED
jgi:hypothetical protein